MNAARVLGILGGLIGIVFVGFWVWAFTGDPHVVGEAESGLLVAGSIAIACGVVGIVGALVVTRSPGWATILLAIATVGGFAMVLLWVIPALLLGSAAVKANGARQARHSLGQDAS